MRRVLKLIAITIALIIAVGAAISDFPFVKKIIGEKFFEEPEIRVEASILPNGSMLVKEQRTIHFNGDFTRYRRQIPIKGYREIVDVRVSELNRTYSRLASVGSDRPDARYTFTKGREGKDEVFNIELYFHARDEQRTFIIEYRVVDVVKVHTDVAELYWQFAGLHRSVEIDKMDVTLTLPGGAQPDEIKVWGHGPVRGDVKKISAEKVTWSTTDLPINKFLEGRVVFPTRLVPQAVIKTSRAALPEILTEEQAWANQRIAEEHRNLLSIIGAFLIAFAGLALAYYFYARYGRKYRPRIETEYYRELPGTYSPAEAGYIYDVGKVNPPVLSATLMDLARRGYVRLEPMKNSEDKDDVVLRQMKPAGEELRPHERLFMDFFFNQIGQMQPAVWFSALSYYTKQSPEMVRNFVDSFKSMVGGSVIAMDYFDAESRSRSAIELWSAVLCTVAAIIALLMGNFYYMFVFLIVGIAMGIACRQSRDFNQEGQNQYELWLAFRRFLTDFSNLDKAELPQLILWEHYLVYAVVLGVAAEVIHQLPVVYPEIRNPDSGFGGYWGGGYYGHSYSHTAGQTDASPLAGFTGFSSIMSSMNDSWDSAFSSASSSVGSSGGDSGSGDGGGFSGGGGDGGGGGGSDAS